MSGKDFKITKIKQLKDVSSVDKKLIYNYKLSQLYSILILSPLNCQIPSEVTYLITKIQ